MRKHKTLIIRILYVILAFIISVAGWQMHKKRQGALLRQRLPGVIFTAVPDADRNRGDNAFVDPKSGAAIDVFVKSFEAAGALEPQFGSRYGVLECRRNGNIYDITGQYPLLLYTFPVESTYPRLGQPCYIDETHISVLYNGDLYIIDLGAGAHWLYIPNIDWYRWNTDRTELYYRSNNVVYRRSYPDGDPEKLYEGKGIVSENGEYLLYIKPTPKTREVLQKIPFSNLILPRFCVRELATGREWNSPLLRGLDYDISPDGQYVAYVGYGKIFELVMRVWEVRTGTITEVLSYGTERPILLEWLSRTDYQEVGGTVQLSRIAYL